VFFIEAQITGDGAHKPWPKTRRQPGPIFIFEGFDETRANAGSLGGSSMETSRISRFALQAFTKISPAMTGTCP